MPKSPDFAERLPPDVGDIVMVSYPAGTTALPAIVVAEHPGDRRTVCVFQNDAQMPFKLRPMLEPYSEQHPYGWHWPDHVCERPYKYETIKSGRRVEVWRPGYPKTEGSPG